jgi:uncharacterized RDD family membrane protein YckC
MDNSNPNFKNNFLERAGILKRFLNYVIDLIVFVLAFGLIVLIFLPKQIVQDVENINPIFSNLLYTFLFGIFIGTVEGLLRGKTFGKYLTNTLTVNKDGSKIDFITGFMRGLIKIVPFCPLSALSSIPHPWQDTWSNTVVIDVKLTQSHNLNLFNEIGKENNN